MAGLSQRFSGKAVIVTGGASGIGKATAERLAAEGANIAIADINADSASTVAQSLAERFGIKAASVAFNAAEGDSCRAMVDRCVELLGGRLDVLCNIAGIMDWGHTTDFTEARWERMLKINLSSVFYITQHAIPHLVKSKGNVVNMSSAAGLMGIAYTVAYCAAKAGVVAITKSLAIEFASSGVRVNAIAPGGVKTPMHASSTVPANINMKLIERLYPKLNEAELCEPEDIAAAVSYLASDDARFVTGVAFAVDGGQTAG